MNTQMTNIEDAELERLLEGCWKPSVRPVTEPARDSLITLTLEPQKSWEKPTLTVTSHEDLMMRESSDGKRHRRAYVIIRVTWKTTNLQCHEYGSYHSPTEKKFTSENRPEMYAAAANNLLAKLEMTGAWSPALKVAIQEHLDDKATQFAEKAHE